MTKTNICIVGLGYVGLPLAVAFSNHYPVVGFDTNAELVAQLQQGNDPNNEVETTTLQAAKVTYTTDPSSIAQAQVIIITVPTPIDAHKQPDLTALKAASETVGKHLQKGSIVVYESTVYPGVTEDICIPILAEHSQLKHKEDFTVGYSPERINPGDKVHTLSTVVKIVAGCDKKTTQQLVDMYKKIITAGIHQAPTIKVAEASKVIENIQRDVMVAMMNEFKMIFDTLNVNMNDVLAAARTKWNFPNFTPGLVGGHCIGVDPHYLAYEAQGRGNHPEMILTARKINDDMSRYEARRLVKHLAQKNINGNGKKVLVLGATFKPNVSDLRNSKIQDFVQELKAHNLTIDICDPHVAEKTVHGCANVSVETMKNYAFVVKAVPHKVFESMKVDYTLFVD